MQELNSSFCLASSFILSSSLLSETFDGVFNCVLASDLIMFSCGL